MTMILQHWRLIAVAGCIFVCMSDQAGTQKRRCVFQANAENNNNYIRAGNVSGSEQVCEHTHCCVAYYSLIYDGQWELDVLACSMVEEICPDATCKAQTHFNRVVKCVCDGDLCNGNISWTSDLEEPRLTDPYAVDVTVAVIILAGALTLCLVIFAVKWRHASREKIGGLQDSSHDSHASPVCSCQMPKTSRIDMAEVELLQMMGKGSFATVWQGTYQGSTVAVKVVPSGSMNHFNRETEVYELPLMSHEGIIHFLGTGRKPGDGSWLTVLQYAEYGSLHSFLCAHTSSWVLSQKLCQSLSEGLSYLHSDLHGHGIGQKITLNCCYDNPKPCSSYIAANLHLLMADVHKPPVAHQDLSSFNVLVKADCTCALSDFGCSTILRSCSGRHWRKSNAGHTEARVQVGTLRYMSPEVLEGSVNLHDSWCLQADVYALGLLLWEIWMRCSDLFTGGIVPQRLLPYESEMGDSVTWETLTQYVSHLGKRPSIPKHWELLPQGSNLPELLENCWDCDPDARLTAPHVVDKLASFQTCLQL